MLTELINEATSTLPGLAAANSNIKAFSASSNRIFRLTEKGISGGHTSKSLNVTRVYVQPNGIVEYTSDYCIKYLYRVNLAQGAKFNAVVIAFKKVSTDKFYINDQTGEIYMHVSSHGGEVYIQGGAETIENAVDLVDLTTLTKLTVV